MAVHLASFQVSRPSTQKGWGSNTTSVFHKYKKMDFRFHDSRCDEPDPETSENFRNFKPSRPNHADSGLARPLLIEEQCSLPKAGSWRFLKYC